MQKIQSAASFKCTEGKNQRQNDCLLVETPLQIIVNGQDLSLTMQTPGDERYLVRGLLHSEGISSHAFESFSLEEWEQGIIARLKIFEQDKIQGRRFGSSPSCGICGKRNVEQLFSNLEALEDDFLVSAEFIQEAFSSARKDQLLFALTGGSHAAAAFDQAGQVLCLFEDVGRHNAVDKVIGFLLEKDLLAQAKLLTVSGRVSFEIIQKCNRANIPILASISAPSSLAVEWAEKLNMTLAAFCREDRVTFYSSLERAREVV
ncbi:formate dehydrogenase accessory sulfurtransferase FdhD [Lentisphaera marina]|uniref:formate dehydrogenase accessory sulfurtransferase FdhD n=1 Tax=Lentisphaera marina TaxID=1111041 RepID=UPI002365B2C8|nr:formate dehydrogenase accessory sulfurtransferase FdhD [Lentisphaera marina]MDD7983659.1 formate dehydrogenase accessory sulfurtransferase FdhD [Lentisphaera marina]